MAAIEIRPPGGEKPGALVGFPYDRALVQRFRLAFPRARWRDAERAWFVPGTTAERRLQRWLAREVWPGLDLADERGRDAFAFEPIDSPYLEAGTDLRLKTPFSRTIVEILRTIAWAWWDEAGKVWRVPFRSYDELRRRWGEIEAAARRNEPEARQRRREAAKETEEGRQALRRAAERRRHRYPVPLGDLPPLHRPVTTPAYGTILFEAVSGEVVEPAAAEFYPQVEGGTDHVWAAWRPAEEADLAAAWPRRHPPDPSEQARGWWLPGREDYAAARRRLRSLQRAARSRNGGEVALAQS